MAAGMTADDPWAPREAAFRRARSHSRTVRMLKVVLPLAAVGVSLSFGAAAWRASPAAPALPAEEAAVADGRLVMANPTLGGVTDENQPYSMMAERAIQVIGQDDIVDLEAINAALPLEGGEVATIKAHGGTYDRKSNTLALKSVDGVAISITTTDGMSASARTATIGIEDGSMDAEGSVAVSTQKALLTAERLSVRGGGDVLVFERNVRMTIEPGGIETANSGDGDENL